MPNQNYVAEYDAIISVVNQYVEGVRKGSGATTRRAFHDKATIFGYIGGTLLGPEIQKLYDVQDRNGPSLGVETRVTHVEIAETAASVRLDTNKDSKPLFTDFMNFAKLDGVWIIVSKVFHRYG